MDRAATPSGEGWKVGDEHGEDRAVSRRARTAKIAQVAARHTVREAAGAVRRPFLDDDERRRARDERVLRLADDLVDTLGSMKGVAMKLGQIVSLLNFGISSAEARDEFARRLQPLFSQARPVSTATMLKVMDQEWGSARRMVRHVDPEPMAVASLGQVYRGVLDDGREVAIKVQYPWIKPAVRADLKNLQLIVKLRSRVYPVQGLEFVVDEVCRQIELELDYRQELVNHVEVHRSHLGHPVFHIPDPVVELCTDKILVTELIHGTSLDAIGQLAASDRDRIGEAIYRFYCGSLYSSGHFCADPHPGNIVVEDDGRVAFLDFGLFVRMTAAEIDVERRAVRAAMDGDAQATHRYGREAGFIIDDDALPPEEALAYVRAAAGWYLLPGCTTITRKTVHRALQEAMMPQSSFQDGIFAQQMPRNHAFSRRTEMSVVALLGTLEATASWHGIAREWIFGDAPSTDMGRTIALWQPA
jgi:predicted unusual protein kinase regulating ubiquinone biosynthesis (AarF/ABC1/UbiB family)